MIFKPKSVVLFCDDKGSTNMQNAKYRVLCVCLGNICRSPTAEVILQQTADRAGLNIWVDSAGTSNYHPNKAPDPRSQKYAMQHGYDLSHLRARQIQLEDFEKFDLILAMDHDNLQDLKTLQTRFLSQKKQSRCASLALMSEHDSVYPKQAVPDPYYGDVKDFERVISQCESSSHTWVKYWQDNKII